MASSRQASHKLLGFRSTSKTRMTSPNMGQYCQSRARQLYFGTTSPTSGPSAFLHITGICDYRTVLILIVSGQNVLTGLSARSLRTSLTVTRTTLRLSYNVFLIYTRKWSSERLPQGSQDSGLTVDNDIPILKSYQLFTNNSKE